MRELITVVVGWSCEEGRGVGRHEVAVERVVVAVCHGGKDVRHLVRSAPIVARDAGTRDGSAHLGCVEV